MERCGLHSSDQLCIVEEVNDHGTILGAVGFDTWTPNSCRMHVALDRPESCRRLVKAAFVYPFEQSGKSVVLCEIRESNAKSIALAKHFGFTERLRIKDGWDIGEALVLLEMRKADCRWLERERKAA
jgi:hypothetical protein